MSATLAQWVRLGRRTQAVLWGLRAVRLMRRRERYRAAHRKVYPVHPNMGQVAAGVFERVMARRPVDDDVFLLQALIDRSRDR